MDRTAASRRRLSAYFKRGRLWQSLAAGRGDGILTKATPDRPKVPEAIKLVSTGELPLDMRNLEVDDEGRLLVRDDESPLRFSFEFAGAPFQAEVTAGDAPLVKLTGDLGVLPYTIESPAARRWALRVIAASSRLSRGRLELDSDYAIRLRAAAPPPARRNPVTIVSTVTALLLDFRPCLELLSEVLKLGRARTSLRPALR